MTRALPSVYNDQTIALNWRTARKKKNAPRGKTTDFVDWGYILHNHYSDTD